MQQQLYTLPNVYIKICMNESFNILQTWQKTPCLSYTLPKCIHENLYEQIFYKPGEKLHVYQTKK